jgi:hypothetical protein
MSEKRAGPRIRFDRKRPAQIMAIDARRGWPGSRIKKPETPYP